jgi:hypothetical protein
MFSVEVALARAMVTAAAASGLGVVTRTWRETLDPATLTSMDCGAT